MLELSGLTKKFHVAPVVNDVSFSVQPSEIVGYLGPNGAGKTTTIKMLAGLLRPTSGKILYNGTDVKKDIYTYKKKLGYVPEDSEIYPHLSASDYLLMVGRLRHIQERVLKEKIAEFMRLFHLYDDMDSALFSYSKGMVQKVLISSALLHNPEIVLLDEPLSGLDVTTGLVIKYLLQRLAQEGKIIVYSSHILEVVEKVCSRVVIIHKGKIVADDSVSNLEGLMKLQSLEKIFGQLVVQEDTGATAKELVEVMKYGS